MSVVKRDAALRRPLRVLVPLIKEELAAGQAAGVAHYRQAGEMLIEAKEQVEGEWQDWLEENFHLTDRTARIYMQLARKMDNGTTGASVRQILRPDASPDPAWHRPVQAILTERLNVERLAEDRQNREKEERLIRQLGHQLIDIGYKVLAAKLHPDKGGSSAAMARLTRVRARLRKAL